MLPDPEVVAGSTPKAWLVETAHREGFPFPGKVVRSVRALASAVADRPGPALVKDPYGVSSQGLIEVVTPGVLKSLCRVLDRQVSAGKRVELVVQPKLGKQYDFSAHLTLYPDGTWT